MSKIVPTIFVNDATSFNHLFDIYKTFAKRIQIVISDSRFIPLPSLDLANVSIPSDWDGDIDLYMMVKNPSAYLHAILKLHPSLCIFHAECEENLLPIYEQLNAANIKTGIALLETTYPGDVKQYLESADHALIFATSLQDTNAEPDMLQLEKSPIIKEIDSNIEIGWFGGVSMDNIRTITHNNIDIINIDNALSQSPNAAEAFQAMSAETEKQGINL